MELIAKNLDIMIMATILSFITFIINSFLINYAMAQCYKVWTSSTKKQREKWSLIGTQEQ